MSDEIGCAVATAIVLLAFFVGWEGACALLATWAVCAYFLRKRR